MKLRMENVKLRRVDGNGEARLIGRASHIDLAVQVDQLGRASVDFPHPWRAICMSIDVSAEQFRVMYRDHRWETLRHQAKRKRRPGWRALARA